MKIVSTINTVPTFGHTAYIDKTTVPIVETVYNYKEETDFVLGLRKKSNDCFFRFMQPTSNGGLIFEAPNKEKLVLRHDDSILIGNIDEKHELKKGHKILRKMKDDTLLCAYDSLVKRLKSSVHAVKK